MKLKRSDATVNSTIFKGGFFMKYSLLIAVLFSAPLLAVKSDGAMEQAQREINEAWSDVKAAEARVEQLAKKIEESNNAAGSFAGKYEQRDHVEKHNSHTASNVTAHDKAREDLESKHAKYESVRQRVGRKYLINEDGNHITLSRQPQQPAGEPIKSAYPSKTYAGSSYRSARPAARAAY